MIYGEVNSNDVTVSVNNLLLLSAYLTGVILQSRSEIYVVNAGPSGSIFLAAPSKMELATSLALD